MAYRPRIDALADSMLERIAKELNTTKSDACISAIALYFAALRGVRYEDDNLELEAEKNALCKKRNS